MDYMIAVFRARSHTINFANILRSYGVISQIVNIPRKANVSCGISVRFDVGDLQTVLQILSRRNFDTFAGIYEVLGNGLEQRVIKLK